MTALCLPPSFVFLMVFLWKWDGGVKDHPLEFGKFLPFTDSYFYSFGMFCLPGILRALCCIEFTFLIFSYRLGKKFLQMLDSHHCPKPHGYPIKLPWIWWINNGKKAKFLLYNFTIDPIKFPKCLFGVGISKVEIGSDNLFERSLGRWNKWSYPWKCIWVKDQSYTVSQIYIIKWIKIM